MIICAEGSLNLSEKTKKQIMANEGRIVSNRTFTDFNYSDREFAIENKSFLKVKQFLNSHPDAKDVNPPFI